jgi:hypothetical protein
MGSLSEKMGVGDTRTGKDAIEFSGDAGDDDDADGDGEGAFNCSGQGGGGKTVGRPVVVPWV